MPVVCSRNHGRGHRFKATSLCEALEARRLLSTTYYLSPGGSDSNSGTSALLPWRSMARVNALDLEPGDRVLFEGGTTFAEPDVAVNIVNPGFESGTSGWDENFGNAQVLVGIGHNSLRALRIGIGEGGMGQIVTSRVQPSRTYTFSCYARTSDPYELGYVGITFKDEFGNSVGGVQLSVGGIFYKQYAKSFVAPSSFAFADIWAYKFAGTTAPFFLDVDNFSLTENKNSIFLDGSDAGTKANPIIFGSYGTGRATINAHSGLGFYGYNVGGYEVRDLNFIGSGVLSNKGSGITFFTDLPGDVKLEYLWIDNVNVSGFGDTGISIGGWHNPFSTTGYRDVRVTNAVVSNNQQVGIHVWGPSLYSHENVTISDNRVSSTTGQDVEGTSGDGLLVGSTNGAIVQRNVVWGNGAAGHGAIGVRTYNSNNVTVQLNESYDNRTSGVIDGGGFALDWGTTNSVLQYNYSHGNDGSGFMLAARSNTPAVSNNTIRYNISENDGRKNGYAGIHVWNESVTISQSKIYNNTVYITPAAAGGAPKAIWLQSPDPYFDIAVTDVRLWNNIVFAAGGTTLVEAVHGQVGMMFQGNMYWTAGAGFSIGWQGTSYSSLSAWRNGTGQERDGPQDVGFHSDPLLTAPGAGGTIGDGSLLGTLSAYRTRAGSPAREAGLNLPLRFGVNPGTRDFYGIAVPQGAQYDIGAHEAAVDDVIAPTVTSGTFHYQTRQDITLVFSEDVSASVQLNDLVVMNLTTGQPVSPNSFVLSLAGGNGAPTTAAWIAQQTLPDGNYRATLPAGSVQDPAGNVLSADYVLDFFILAGDANHDGRVNLQDFNILAANFGQSGRDFTQGDFNYDGVVNLLDFNILASRFGTALAPGAAASEPAAALGTPWRSDSTHRALSLKLPDPRTDAVEEDLAGDVALRDSRVVDSVLRV